MWLNKFKIAIASQNTDAIDKLLNKMPQFCELDQMQEAQYLLKEASSLAKTLQNETLVSMQQIKRNLKFLKSTQTNSKSTLDISL